MPHILIIEDDPELGPLLQRNLQLEGYRVSLAPDGKAGMSAALNGSAQLIILDLMLPFVDGLHILKMLRRDMISTPVIILTAKGTEDERIDGFRAGCDDYVTKPFSLMELIARIRAVLRRLGYRETPSVIHSVGFIIDPHARSVLHNDSELPLAPKEFELLYILASHPDQALSRTFLLDEVWGEESEVTTRTVDAHVSALRHKIETNPEDPTRIVTVYKVGYKWVGTV
jgi:two-component system OmpR family response regulator